MMRKRSTIIAFMLMFLIVACATPTAPTTPKEKLAYMYQVYNAQHEDYMSMSANPILTEEQRDILRAKKPILETLQTLIPTYDMHVQLGSPTIEQEQKIYDLLTQLQNMNL